MQYGHIRIENHGKSDIAAGRQPGPLQPSSAGGLLGLGVGYAAVQALVRAYPGFPATPPLWAVTAALLLSLVVGVAFGVWPARKATRLDPVRALSGR